MSEEGLGALLGAYGSDDDDEDLNDLSHLTSLKQTSASERGNEHDAAEPANPQEQAPIDERLRPPEGGASQAEASLADQPEQPGTCQEPPGEGATTAAEPADMEPETAQQGQGPGALPPELAQPPPGECDPDVQARVARWLQLQARGRLLTTELRSSRDYRNPQFFRKMVEYWEIDEHGTAFAPDVFDPTAFAAEDGREALKSQLEATEERRRAARAAGTGRVEFVKAGQAAAGQAAVPGGMGLRPAHAGLPSVPQSDAQRAALQTAVAAAQAKATAFAAAAAAAKR